MPTRFQNLKGSPTYNIELKDFFSSAFSVDAVVFGFDGQDLKVALIDRGAEPFKGMAAIPGDLVYPNEDIDVAVDRVLKELTGLDKVYLQQVQSFGDVNRHPLGRVVTVAYYALIRIRDLEAASWATSAYWHPIQEIGKLAFDHNDILDSCAIALKEHVTRSPIGFNLLEDKFTLAELQSLYEAILDRKFDKANFRKKILGMKLLQATDQQETSVTHRPARYYQFDPDQYDKLRSKGFVFEL